MDEIHLNRLENVRRALSKKGLTQMLVSDPLSIYYLTGVRIEPFERFFALYIAPDASGDTLFLNNLFTVPETGLKEVWLSDTDDAAAAASEAVDSSSDLGVDKDLRARFLLPIMKAHPDIGFVNSSDCVDSVRAVKDSAEIEKMRESSRINDACTDHMFSFIKEGMSEKECAEEVLRFYRENGAEGPSFTPICSFGANAADPHHEPDGTLLKRGDCIVLDIGCTKDGYCSDMTRTWFCMKSEDPEWLRIHRLVNDAGLAAEKMIRPGVRFCDIDSAAREIIDRAGYGKYFNHRLGHSIGLQDHECDDVSSSDKKEVVPGNIFSIEPGVYLPGKFGVRIEDLVLVTEEGCEVLNRCYRGYKYTN